MIVTNSKPLCEVTIYTEQGKLVARATEDPKSSIDADVVSVKTIRDMGADAPTFSIYLTRRKLWHKWVASNDLITIAMCRPPERKRNVFIGLVDDVRKSIIMSRDGTPYRVVSITGRGLSKAFIEFDVGVVPGAEVLSASVGWLTNQGVNLAGSNSDEIIRQTLHMIGKRFITYQFSDGRTLWDMMSTSLSARSDAKMMQDLGLINFQGSLWAFLKEIADQPWNELFWETDGEKDVLTLRPTPFNPKEWEALPQVFVDDSEIVNEDIGRSDVETYTLFSTGVKAHFGSEDIYKMLGLLPLWYKPFADKYGIRRLHLETSFCPWGSTNALGEDSLRQYQVDLFNWNIKNNQFYNGYVVVQGKAKYKIGTRLFLNSHEDGTQDPTPIDFYVTSVMHEFWNYGTWTTTLGLVRGINSLERFSNPVNQYSEYSGIGWGLYDPTRAKAMLQSGNTGFNPDTGDYSGLVSNLTGYAVDLMRKDNVRYTFGAKTDDVPNGKADCSSLMQYIFRQIAKIDIGRTTMDQSAKGTPVASFNDLQDGDLVFYKNTYIGAPPVSHVGLYIGDGKMIHIDGDEGVGKIHVSTISDYYINYYWGARRILVDKIVVRGGREISGFVATAYGGAELNGGMGTWKTATGTTPLEGRTVAVDPSLIPLNSKVFIECPDYPSVTGVYIAEDTGGAIKEKRVDIYFEDKADPQTARGRMLSFGKRGIKVTLLDEGNDL